MKLSLYFIKIVGIIMGKKIKISKFWRNMFKNKPLMFLVIVLILAVVFSSPKVQQYFNPTDSEAATIEDRFTMIKLTGATGVEQVLDMETSGDQALALVSNQGGDPGLFLHNLITKTKTKLSASTTPYGRLTESLAVWNVDKGNGTGEIYFGNNNPLTELKYKAVANTPVDVTSGSLIAYVGKVGTAKKIIIHNVATQVVQNQYTVVNYTPIGDPARLNLRISGGDWLYWTDKTSSSSKYGLFVYNIKTPNIVPRKVSFGYQTDVLSLEASGSIAVGRVRNSVGRDNIYTYDASAKKILGISNNSRVKSDPWIYNQNLIVYFDHYQANVSISNKWTNRLVAYDFTTKTTATLYKWITPTKETWSKPFFTQIYPKYYGASAKIWSSGAQADVYGMVQK